MKSIEMCDRIEHLATEIDDILFSSLLDVVAIYREIAKRYGEDTSCFARMIQEVFPDILYIKHVLGARCYEVEDEINELFYIKMVLS